VSNKCEASTPDAGSGKDAGSTVDSGSGNTADSGSGNTADSGSGNTADSGSGNTVDSGSGDMADSGSVSTMDSGSSSNEDASADGSTEGDAAGEGGATSPSGNSGGCGCRTAQAREAGPSPALLAFGVLALLGGARLRRRAARSTARAGRSSTAQ